MNNNMVVTLKSSTTEMELNSVGSSTYIIPDLEGLTSLPEIRSSVGVNAGADGGWTSAQYFNARLISMHLVIANEDISVVERTRQKLNSILAQGRAEELVLSLTTEGGSTYDVNVRTSSVQATMNTVLKRQEFLIQFRADDPIIYGSTGGDGIEAVLRVQQAFGGFEIPFEFPLAINGGLGDTIVDNIGSETVYPIITMYGDLHSPTLINRTTNQQMKILADIIGTEEWLNFQAVSGNYIVINDGIDGAPVQLDKINGNTTQTTYTGKNLLDVSSVNTGAGTNGLTVKANADGSLSWSGTTTANWAIITNYTNVSLAAGTYTLSINKTLTHRIYVEATLADSSTQNMIIEPGDTSKTQTFSQAISKIRVDLAAMTVSQAYNEGVYIQLELGSTATPWEPYVGATPSPNPSYPQTVETVTGQQTVTVAGKNLIENKITNGTIGSDGSIGSNNSFDMYVAKVYQGQQYTMTTGNGFVGSYFTEQPQVGSHSYDGGRIVQTGTETYTVTAPITGWIAFRAAKDYNTPQFELGSTATTYEAPNITNYEVNLGKNLLQGADNSSHGVDTTYDATTGVFSMSGTPDSGTVQLSINIYQNIASGTYTLSTTSASSFGKRIRAFHADDTYDEITIAANATSATGTFTDTIVRYNILATSMTTGTLMSDSFGLQLERGSSASSFAPYFTPIELCKIGTYQDYIWNDEGTWKIHKATGNTTFSGSEDITLYNTQNSILGVTLPTGVDVKMGSLPISDHFQTVSMGTYNSANREYGQTSVHNSSTRQAVYASAPDSTITTVAQFKTWLGSNPSAFYYVLDVATDTAITDATLIAQLDAINDAKLKEGTNNIMLVPSYGAQGTLDIEYPTDVNRTSSGVIVIDSLLKTVTLNGTDIYGLINDGSSFLEIAPGENHLALESEQTSDNGYAEVKYKQGFLSI